MFIILFHIFSNFHPTSIQNAFLKCFYWSKLSMGVPILKFYLFGVPILKFYLFVSLKYFHAKFEPSYKKSAYKDSQPHVHSS